MISSTWLAAINARLSTLVILFFCLLAAACGSGPDAPWTDEPVLVRPDPGVMGDGELASILEYVIRDTGVPAVAAMFIHDGVVLEQSATGLRAVRLPGSIREDDKWHLGSLTKSMTATLAAALSEQGVVTWDTTIADVFPEFAGVVDSAYLDVRLDELLSHTGGISSSSSSIANTVVLEGGDLRTQRYRFAELALAASPAGSRGSFAYSNAGYVIAGAMLERLTGTSWELLMEQQVFGPLGMQSSGFGAPGTAGMNDQPTGHVPEGASWHSIPAGSPDADNPAMYGPAGTVHSTLADVVHYMSAHLAGANGAGIPGFLSAESFAKLHQPMPGTAYSLGWDVADTGITHIGSNDRWLAQMIIVPDYDIAVFIAINAADAEGVNGGEPVRALTLVGEYLQQRFEAAMSGN